MIVHSLKIAVSDYQFQLLSVKLGKPPYKANYKNAMGKLIMASYGDKAPVPKRKPNPDEKYFEIIIPPSWVERHGVTFPSEKAIEDFIETLDHSFKRELYAYIDGVLEFKENYNRFNNDKIVAKMKDAATRFLDKYGFNEDLVKFESIKKGYQRYVGQSRTIARVA